MKYKRYKKVKKVILAGASSGIVAGMLIMGVGNTALAAETADSAAPAYTQSSSYTGMHMMRRWNSVNRVNSLAVQLGLDPQFVKDELKSGKTIKQVLQEQGVALDELQKAYSTTKSQNKTDWKNFKNKNFF